MYCRSICGEKIEKNQGISVCWLLLNTFVLRGKKEIACLGENWSFCKQKLGRVSGNSDTLSGKLTASHFQVGG